MGHLTKFNTIGEYESASELSYPNVSLVDGIVIYSSNESVSSSFEFVDLGLSVKWATCNVGASSPEEFGLYYLWGETYGSNNIDDYTNALSNLKNSSMDLDSGSMEFYKYNATDGKTTIELEDDAAYQMDHTVRIPTVSECQELVDSSTTTWETINGVVGARITSNINGNSIFIPAAGILAPGGSQNVGEMVSVQLNELAVFDNEYSMHYVFHCAGDTAGLSGGMRYMGFPIRPVKI